MNRLKIALQKSGRLNEQSLALLKECGIAFPNGGAKLLAEAFNFPIDLLFLRDDDIPQYVEQGVADIGIVGQNVCLESGKQIREVRVLGFARCRLSLAVPRDASYTGLDYFEGKNIATSYPNILRDYLDTNGVRANIELLSGSVEIAPGIGLAQGICDIVSSGSTLLSNGLKEVAKVMDSEAVLIAPAVMSKEKAGLLETLLFRINAVLAAQRQQYILLNAPDEKIEAIARLLPGMKSPTVLPLAMKGWSSLHSVIREDQFWEQIGALKQAGAEGILVLPIEKMIS